MLVVKIVYSLFLLIIDMISIHQYRLSQYLPALLWFPSLVYIYNYHRYIHRTHLHEDLHHSDNHNYNFYISSLSFFFLNSVEVLVGIFCYPFSVILNIPLTSLNLPIIWNFIFNSKRWNTPYNSIVWLCCIITVF